MTRLWEAALRREVTEWWLVAVQPDGAQVMVQRTRRRREARRMLATMTRIGTSRAGHTAPEYRLQKMRVRNPRRVWA